MTAQQRLHFGAECGVAAASRLKIGFTLRGRLRFESLEEDISNGGLVFGLFNTHTLGLWLFMRAGKENPAKNFKLRKAVEPRKNAQNTKKAEHGEPNALIR